jgi:prevent-host-death family protein
MSKLPNLIPVTDLRQDATGILKRLSASGKSVIITQRGRAAAVLMSVDAYERSQNEADLLRLLAKGEKEVKRGKGHALDEVLKEADSLLSGD